MNKLGNGSDRLVIEKKTEDGGCVLVAQWPDTPKGRFFLSEEMQTLAKLGDAVYSVRHAQPEDDLRNVPSILRGLKK